MVHVDEFDKYSDIEYTNNLIYGMIDALYPIIPNEVYCIFYQDNNDKRMLINYGLFRTREECEQYIREKKLQDYCYPCPIKFNNNFSKFMETRIDNELNFAYNQIEKLRVDYVRIYKMFETREKFLKSYDEYNKDLEKQKITDEN